MKSLSRHVGREFERKFTRWAKPETAEIARFSNSRHGVMAARARGIKALFNQSAAKAKITVRRRHRDGAEKERRLRARDGERPESNRAEDVGVAAGDKAQLGNRGDPVAQAIGGPGMTLRSEGGIQQYFNGRAVQRPFEGNFKHGTNFRRWNVVRTQARTTDISVVRYAWEGVEARRRRCLK